MFEPGGGLGTAAGGPGVGEGVGVGGGGAGGGVGVGEDGETDMLTESSIQFGPLWVILRPVNDFEQLTSSRPKDTPALAIVVSPKDVDATRSNLFSGKLPSTPNESRNLVTASFAGNVSVRMESRLWSTPPLQISGCELEHPFQRFLK